MPRRPNDRTPVGEPRAASDVMWATGVHQATRAIDVNDQEAMR